MFRPKREKKQKVKLTKESYAKARQFFHYLKPYKGTFLIGWIFLALSSLTAMVFPMLIGPLFAAPESGSVDWNNLGSADALNNVNAVAVLLFLTFLAQAVFSFLRVYLFSRVSEGALHDLRVDAFSALMFKPMSFFSQHRVGELSSRIATDINLLQETLQTTIAELFRQVITIVVSIALLFYFSPKLTLIMLGTIPVMAILAVVFGRFIRKLSRRAQDFSADSNAVLEESLTNISAVKAYTNEGFEINRFGKYAQEIKRLNILSGLWRGGFVSFIITCMFGAIVFIIWQGQQMVIEDPTFEGFFMSFVFLTIMIGASIGSLPELYSKVQKAIGATEHLMNIIASPEEEGVRIGKSGTDKSGTIAGNVTFDNVRFTYPSREEVEVLKGVSFQVDSGKSLALVGASGAGKSTITQLLLKFYKANAGEIRIDGKSISEYPLRELREKMAIVPQEVMLFNGSIEENIAYGRPNATKEEVLEAARQAGALEFIEQMPAGMETLVGDRGIQLSGGQRQRVAIARAILRNPAILILDEATSALDSKTEASVQEALNTLMAGRTTIVVAHRLSTIQNADQILVLEHGEVVETGSHQELITLDGAYKKYYEAQRLEQAMVEN